MLGEEVKGIIIELDMVDSVIDYQELRLQYSCHVSSRHLVIRKLPYTKSIFETSYYLALICSTPCRSIILFLMS